MLTKLAKSLETMDFHVNGVFFRNDDRKDDETEQSRTYDLWTATDFDAMAGYSDAEGERAGLM